MAVTTKIMASQTIDVLNSLLTSAHYDVIIIIMYDKGNEIHTDSPERETIKWVKYRNLYRCEIHSLCRNTAKSIFNRNNSNWNMSMEKNERRDTFMWMNKKSMEKKAIRNIKRRWEKNKLVDETRHVKNHCKFCCYCHLHNNYSRGSNCLSDRMLDAKQREREKEIIFYQVDVANLHKFKSELPTIFLLVSSPLSWPNGWDYIGASVVTQFFVVAVVANIHVQNA